MMVNEDEMKIMTLDWDFSDVLENKWWMNSENLQKHGVCIYVHVKEQA